MAAMKKMFLLCAAPAAAAATAAVASASTLCAAPSEHGGPGRCKAAGGDHLLLQVSRQAAVAPGDFGDGSCSGMDDVKKTCSSNGCKVLAKTTGRSCDQYCRANGRTCVAAWEEVSDNCEVKYAWSCDKPLGGTSDLLCECDAEGGAAGGGGGGGGAGGGSALPDLGLSSLVWADEFDGRAVDQSKWNFVTGGGGFGNNERQYYTERNAKVSGGVLTITAKCQEYGGDSFTSAKLRTKHLAAWGPGHRIDVRARMPQGRGTWPAIWMLPTHETYGEWPHSGEIDIMEAVGCTANKIYGTVHTGAYNHMLHTEKYNSVHTPVGEWHTYSIVWESHRLQWYLDGQHYHTFAPSDSGSEKWPFSQEFYLILNLAVGGSWGGSCVGGSPSCRKSDEFGRDQVMQVDYARVYSL